jgi:hypothetical protein
LSIATICGILQAYQKFCTDYKINSTHTNGEIDRISQIMKDHIHTDTEDLQENVKNAILVVYCYRTYIGTKILEQIRGSDEYNKLKHEFRCMYIIYRVLANIYELKTSKQSPFVGMMSTEVFILLDGDPSGDSLEDR